ncbi:hypothetical protein [Paraburkholderia flagellata]|uniref:hypothetical protein n=1 Tax=Paraburkholderia flagellata TaxID=2883241 RepID=UPI001F323007|nr:hypothetical protein [Paraburkholderia flagellata]
MNDETARTVVIQPPGQGAYRITVVGAQSQTVNRVFSAAGEPVEITLGPDSYNATIESASSGGTTSQAFTVEPAGEGGAPASVQLGADPDFAPSSALTSLPRPRRNGLLSALSELASKLTSAQDWGGLPGASPENAPSRGLPEGDLPLSLPEHATRFQVPPPLPVEYAFLPIVDLEQRAFTVSLSSADLADTAPPDAAEWRAAQSQIEVVQISDSEVMLKLVDGQRPSRAALRLTIAVEGRAPWRVGVPVVDEGVWLTLRPAVAASRPDLVVTMRPVNELTATLIGAVQRALPSEVDSLLVASAKAIAGNDWHSGSADTAAALEALMTHGAAPWASVAAALLMVRTGQIADAAGIAQTLGTEYDWIADASVAAAWAFAAAAENDADSADERIDDAGIAPHCLALLAHARRIGPPCLAASNTLALQMLASMAMNATRETDAKAWREERRLWSTRSRRAVPIGAFFGWELEAGSPPLELQASSDNVIAHGSVTGKGLHCSMGAPA